MAAVSGLRARLVVGVLGAAIVVYALAFVGFVAWQLDEIRSQSLVNLHLKTFQVRDALALTHEENWRSHLQEIARSEEFAWTLLGASRASFSTSSALLQIESDTFLVSPSSGYHHAEVKLSGEVWHRLVGSWPVQGIYDAVFQRAQSGLFILLVWLVLLVGLTTVFYRRLVIQPVERLKQLVGRGDTRALSQFGNVQSGEFGYLGRGIIAMNQKIQDDAAALSERLDALVQAQAQLVRAERLAVVGQLAAGLAHEVGNPLTVLSGYVDMMAAGNLQETQQEKALESMSRELSRMDRTIRDLLDFSRHESGEEERASIADALGHVQRLLSSQSRWRKICVEVQLPPNLPAIRIPQDTLVQVFLNLALNACAAMEGKGTLAFGCDEIKQGMRLWIDDSGPGVPPARRQEIFEPFYTTRSAGEGTGLGLSVCENLVTRHGGQIVIDDSPLGGARFLVILLKA